MLAMDARKHILCEKALKAAAVQARTFVRKAQAENLFFMKTSWTRSFPIMAKIKELLRSAISREPLGSVVTASVLYIPERKHAYKHFLAELASKSNMEDEKVRVPRYIPYCQPRFSQMASSQPPQLPPDLDTPDLLPP